jgi:hypothetical protein
MQIVSRYDSANVLIDGEGTLLDLVKKAAGGRRSLSGADLKRANLTGINLRNSADLTGADLTGANLTGAYLSGAYLSGTDLSLAFMAGANLSDSDLRSANLCNAYMCGTNLSNANLSGADLRGAYLGGADLRDTNLSGAKIRWTSHTLVAELLKRAACDDVEKRKVAGLIAISTDWCWKEFSAMEADPLFPWAIETLAAWVTEGDNAPYYLTKGVG